ncbi:hypothetical protein HZF05_16770 [Sphingomonas sp. CGMCC 1.13654]|uniref:STAS/SEC14 domain-containing protein n=1 Tax=Sphingomonas chungangi TaxID=2683589 RepID=A0A838L9M9_9SPHN|nr:hypothetical protein [Sphingomonas chungangi]MBA2935737.1 hypothetical protein [Sphingomonas chungangi]MVW54428.1 hypothetical protein [Sphingomonas chungangi]
MIEREFDEATGTISVRGTGLYSFMDVEQHYVALRELVARVRSSGRPVRVLSDVTHGVRQAGWVEDYILDQMTQTFEAGDRIAFLTANYPDRAHIQDIGGHLVRSFTSRSAAEQWLAAPEDAAGQ